MPRTHKSLPRLFVEFPLGKDYKVALSKNQSLYLAAVLRKTIGDEAVLFNGRDGAWLGRIESAAKKSVNLTLIAEVAPQPAPSDLWYGFAPLKVGRLDYVIQKATEMGVDAIQPVLTRFTQVSRINRERMAANAIEAAEQCEVLNVPEILGEVTLDALIAGWKDAQGDRRLIFADESAPSGSPIEALIGLSGERFGVLIGPEGGFAEEERALLCAQPFIVPISLGPRILRADTAAVAVFALAQSIIGDWR